MLKGPSNYFKLGDFAAFCDRCGFRFHASELRKEWQGFMVCAGCYEPRNQQDFIRSIPEKPAPPFSRPRNDGPSPLIPSYPVGTPASAVDNAGTTYFTPYAPADRSRLGERVYEFSEASPYYWWHIYFSTVWNLQVYWNGELILASNPGTMDITFFDHDGHRYYRGEYKTVAYRYSLYRERYL
jgi:hypothetical protein